MDEQTVKRILDAPPRGVRKALKNAAVAYCRLTRSRRTFVFRGRYYHYFYHTYNLAWRNERAVEIPIAMERLLAHQGQEVLEVGNVLSHYTAVGHDIIDRYEVAEGVINEDAVDFKPSKQYDLILSVSTLEHIGTCETPPDPGRVVPAVANLVGLLKPGGELIATAPLGFNPEFDALVERGEVPFGELYALRRVGRKNEWEEADFSSVEGAEYQKSAFRANAIIVGIIRKGQPVSAQ